MKVRRRDESAKRRQLGGAGVFRRGRMGEVSEKETILIVDDSLANIRYIMGVFSGEYNTVFAKDGKAALSVAAKQSPDLILLDVVMPEMDGYATIRELKRNIETRHIPVMFVTSLDSEEDEARGLALGAVDYISKPFNISLMRARVRSHLELKRHRDNLQAMVNERTMEIVTRLVHVAESRDTDTGMHIRRICEYSRMLATKAGLPPRYVQIIAQASAMHDIGKVGIPDSILLKPGRLDPEEWEIMKSHSRIGYENLKGSSSKLLQTGCEIALTHHERWDGTGYPHGLKGEEIPISGRIVGIVDVFDALVTRRPYKEPWPLEKAFGLIEAERGKHFDPSLADIFLENRDTVVEIMQTYEDGALPE